MRRANSSVQAAPGRGIEFSQNIRPRFEQDDPDPVRVDVRVVGGQGFVDDSVDLGGNLYPRGAAPYDDEGQRRFRDISVREGGLLEAFDHPIADAQGVPEPPHRQAVLLDARDAEEVRLPAQGQDQMIVGKLPAVGVDATVLEVYVPKLRPSEARTGLNERSAQCLRYVPDVHVAADYPGHHGPESKVVLPGDDHYPDVVTVPREVAEGLRGCVTAEPASQDEHLVGELSVRGFLQGAYLGRGSRNLRKSPTVATAPPTARPAFASLFKKPSRDPYLTRVLWTPSSLYQP